MTLSAALCTPRPLPREREPYQALRPDTRSEPLLISRCIRTSSHETKRSER